LTLQQVEVSNTLERRTATDGLGDSNNDRPYWNDSTTVFEDNLYVGTRNFANMGEMWQMLQQIFLPLAVRNN